LSFLFKNDLEQSIGRQTASNELESMHPEASAFVVFISNAGVTMADEVVNGVPGPDRNVSGVLEAAGIGVFEREDLESTIRLENPVNFLKELHHRIALEAGGVPDSERNVFDCVDHDDPVEVVLWVRDRIEAETKNMVDAGARGDIDSDVANLV
jgi:hypothetical protein